MKRVFAAIILAAVLTALSSCGAKFSDVGINAVGGAVSPVLEGGYKAADCPIEGAGAVSESITYIRESADIVSDTVIVLRARESGGADALEKLCRDYLSDRTDEGYISQVSAYDLPSAAKLKAADIARYENYVVVCISGADTVKAVFSAVRNALYG